MGLEAAELARWTRFAAKGGIGKCTALCDCVAESQDDLMFLKGDGITVLYQLPDHDGLFLGYCEGVVGRFNSSDVHFHSKLKKPVMTKRSSVTAAKSPSPAAGKAPSPAPSPLGQRPPSSAKRTSSSSKKELDINEHGLVLERRTSSVVPSRVMSPLSYSNPASNSNPTSAVQTSDDEFRPPKLPHMSYSSTSTGTDSTLHTPARGTFPSPIIRELEVGVGVGVGVGSSKKNSLLGNNGLSSPPSMLTSPTYEIQTSMVAPIPQPAQASSSTLLTSTSALVSSPLQPSFSLSLLQSEQINIDTDPWREAPAPTPSPLNLQADNSMMGGTSPLRITKRLPTSPRMPTTNLSNANSSSQSLSQLPSPSASTLPFESSPSTFSPSSEHANSFSLGSSDAQGIGLSLLQDLADGLDSDSDSDADTGRPDLNTQRQGQRWSRASSSSRYSDDPAYAEALSRVGRRDSMDESTVEGLGYAMSEDSDVIRSEDEDSTKVREIPAPQEYQQQRTPQVPLLSESPIPIDSAASTSTSTMTTRTRTVYSPNHLSPTTSPTSVTFSPKSTEFPSSSSLAHALPSSPPRPSPYYAQERERRPSQASAFSSNSNSNTNSTTDVNSEWDGASDIYDDYRYSRYSVASKMSRFSVLTGSGSLHGAQGVLGDMPPIPDGGYIHGRPSLDSVGKMRPESGGTGKNESSRMSANSGGAQSRFGVDISKEGQNDALDSGVNLKGGVVQPPPLAQSQGGAPDQGQPQAALLPPFSRRSLFKERTVSIDSDMSVYTQNSRLSTLSQDAVALMSGDPFSNSKLRTSLISNSTSTNINVKAGPNIMSNPTNPPSALSYTSRPAPLNIVQSATDHSQPVQNPIDGNYQNHNGDTEHQPLLNTTWGSPLSSPGMPSPKSSGVFYTPLPGIVGGASSVRDSIVSGDHLGMDGGMGVSLALPTVETMQLTGGGIASAMRQRLEEDRKSPNPESQRPIAATASDMKLTEMNSNSNSSMSAVSGAGLGNRIVVEDEDELPSRIFNSTVDTHDLLGESSQDIDMSLVSSAEPSLSVYNDSKSMDDRRASVFGEEWDEKQNDGGNEKEGIGNEKFIEGGNETEPSSPIIPSIPPIIATPDTSIPSPSSTIFTNTTDSLSHSHLRPSLAALREGAGELIPGTNKRRSLFLPHPNAPRAPVGATTTGPMFLAAQERGMQVGAGVMMAPHLQRQGPPNTGFAGGPPPTHTQLGYPHPQQPLHPPHLRPGQTYPPQQQHPPRAHLFATIRLALSLPPRPLPPPSATTPLPAGPNGIRPPILPRGPTIYGRTDGDLPSAPGPIPMIWSVDPPPATAPRNVTSPSGGVLPVIGGVDAVGVGGGGMKRPPRSLSLGPSPKLNVNTGVGVGGDGGGGGGAATTITAGVVLKVGGGGPTGSINDHPTQINGGITEDIQPTSKSVANIIPRANFIAKVPGLRPRSRSFSGFNSTTVEVPMPISRGREDTEFISAGDVKRSLTTASLTVPPSSSIPSPSSTKPILGTSPLRPSPLSLSSRASDPNLRPSISSPALKSPSSPLTHSALTQPPTSPPPPSPSIGTFNSNVNLRPSLRSSASRSTLSEVPHKPSQLPSRVASLQIGARSDGGSTNSLNDSDALSIHSMRSQLASPPIVTRQTSLRSKLSLPNLRRKQNRTEDDPPLTSPSATQLIHDSEMLQVQDMEFELVRPSLSRFQGAARTSEDSVVLGKDNSLDMKGDPGSALGSAPDSANLLRPESPAISISSGALSGQRSPGVDSINFAQQQMSGSGAGGSSNPPSRSATDTESSSMDAHRQRELKWMSIMQNNPASQARKSKKIRKLLLDGVPSSVRYLVWSHLTDGKSRCVTNVYAQYSKRGKVASSAEIERDIRVLFRDQPYLQETQGPVLTLLQAYLNMFSDVQYSKGLTLIVAQLLLLAPEEDAFWIFVSIMDTHIRPYFSSTNTQMEVDAALFSRALENNESAVAKKLFVEMGILPGAICRPWFSSLFVGVLPPEYLVRVWDLFLFEGIPFLLRVALALITCSKRDLLASTSEESVLHILAYPPQAWLPSPPDAFLSLVLNNIKLKDDDVRKQRVKMEMQVKRQTQSQASGATSRTISTTGLISLPRTS